MQRNKRKRAFTLLEIMISTVLLTIGVLALMQALFSSYGTVEITQKVEVGTRFIDSALETLKSYEDFGKLYAKFSPYNGTTKKFYYLDDGTIYWDAITALAASSVVNVGGVNKRVLGEGLFHFVTNETNTNYPVAEWGTSTAFDTTVTGSNGAIDLNGDGDATDTAVILGRTAGSVVDLINNIHHIILPVKITVRIYGKNGTGDMLERIRYAWISPPIQ